MPPLRSAIKLQPGQESRLLTQIQDNYDEALQSRQEIPLRSAERYRRYLADPTLRLPGPWPEAARLFIPITRAVFERLHSEIWQGLFASLLNIQAHPLLDEAITPAERVSRFVRWSLNRPLKIAQPGGWNSVSQTLLFDALCDSVGVAKVTAWTPPWPAPSRDARQYLSRIVNIDPLDLGMLLVAPDAEGLQYPQCRYIHEEFYLSEDDILRLSRAGFDTPDKDELGDSQQPTERKRVELEREGDRVVDFRPDSILFVESYERFALDPDDEETDIIVSWFPDAQIAGTSDNTASNHGRIAGVRRLIDVFPQDDRPRRPYFPTTVWPQPRQWRGMNAPDRMESMQDLINRLHEQMVNYGDVSMLPFVFVNTFLTGELPDLRTVRPGETVPIDDISGVQFAPTRSLNRHFMEQISLAHANVERDMHTDDSQLGRRPERRERTATAALATMQEAKKSFSMLVRHSAEQFGDILTFAFSLWQHVIPDGTYAQIYDASASNPDTDVVAERTPDADVVSAWDRLFQSDETFPAGRPPEPRYVAKPTSKSDISGLFDVTIEVNPELQFDRQVMMQLFQLTAPALQNYPLGTRLMLKRLWAVFDQRGFDAVYPERIAQLEYLQRTLAAEVQITTFEMQLQQLQQQEAQQKLQLLQQGAQQHMQTGQIDPQYAAAIQSMLGRPQNGQAQRAGGG